MILLLPLPQQLQRLQPAALRLNCRAEWWAALFRGGCQDEPAASAASADVALYCSTTLLLRLFYNTESKTSSVGKAAAGVAVSVRPRAEKTS